MDHNTKKGCFKEGNGEEDTDVMVESGSSPKISWKDKLLGLILKRLIKKSWVLLVSMLMMILNL